MAFTGLDDLISEMALGKKQRLTANRIINTGATSAAGRWHDAFAVSNGTGGIGVLTGTAGLGAERNAASPGALPISPVNVTTDTRHLLAMMAVTPAATVVPGIAKLIDILYVYPSCSIATGAGTTLSNAAAKPTRFNNGKDVKLGCVVAGTAIGATVPIITTSYTDQDGNAGAAGFFAASAASLPIGACLSGAAVSVLGSPEMLLAAGDSGVRSLDSYTVATGTTGAITFFLYRELAEVPLITANLAGERDFLSQIPSLPTVDDNACLAALVLVGGALVASSPLILTLQLAWG